MDSMIEMDTMVSALNECGLGELPTKLGRSDVWAKAILKVTKSDGSRNYCIAENTQDTFPKIIKDYGNMAAITKIEAIYPVLLLDKTNMPDLRSQKDCINYLSVHGVDKDMVAKLLNTKDVNGEPKSEEETSKGKKAVKDMIIKNAIMDVLNRHKQTVQMEKGFDYGQEE